MNDLLNSLARPDWPGAPDGRTLLFMILLAFTTGMLIGFVYMWTHEALSYSRTFVGALAVMPVIISMLMASMSGSLLVAFGLLAVFGVVRFRNVLKDTRDTSYILWVIMEGLAIGTARFSTAVVSGLGIGAAFLLLRMMNFGVRNRYDAVLSLRITGDLPVTMQLLKNVLKRHATELNLASERRSTTEGTDVSYRLLLRDTARSSELQAELARTEGLQNVSVYLHEDEAEI
jgi:ABC-type Fe3+ transport system permease subunit